MGLLELLIGIIFTLSVSTGFGMGGIGDASANDFNLARAAFIVAAAALSAGFFYWVYSERRDTLFIVLLGACAGAYVFIATPLLIRWVDTRAERNEASARSTEQDRSSQKPSENTGSAKSVESDHEPIPSSPPTAPPLIKLGKVGNAKISGNLVVGQPRSLLDVAEGDRIEVENNQSLDGLPPPSIQRSENFSTLTNSRLKEQVIRICEEMLFFETANGPLWDSIANPSPNAIDQASRFEQLFGTRIRAFNGEILFRLAQQGLKEVPFPSNYPFDPIRVGYLLTHTGQLAGRAPIASISSYLRYISSLLNN